MCRGHPFDLAELLNYRCVLRAVMPGTKMQEHSGSEKSVVWSAVDFADEEQKTEMFCMRFASAERAPPAAWAHSAPRVTYSCTLFSQAKTCQV